MSNNNTERDTDPNRGNLKSSSKKIPNPSPRRFRNNPRVDRPGQLASKNGKIPRNISNKIHPKKKNPRKKTFPMSKRKSPNRNPPNNA